MTIKAGDKLPTGTLSEFIEVESAGCTVGPNEFKVDDLTRGKRVAFFGLPGAFTPTCSAKHVPGYVQNIDKLRAKGVDDVICMSVNDAFVMGAWARDQQTEGKVRMMGDGSAAYTKALGLEFDLTTKGLGMRCQRFSMLVDNGVVKALNVEAPGKYEVSDAETLLGQIDRIRGAAKPALGDNDSGWARLAKSIEWISYAAGAIAVVATLFIANTTSSHPEMKDGSIVFGWALAAFFIGGAGVISEYWKDQLGPVKSFSDLMHWLTGGWAAGQFCSIATAVLVYYHRDPRRVDSEMLITAVIGAIVGFLPLAIVAGIAWVGRGFRHKSS